MQTSFIILIEYPASVGRIAYIMVREACLVFREKGEVEKVRVEWPFHCMGLQLDIITR